MNPIRAPFGEEQREPDLLTEISAEDARISRERTITNLRLLWNERRYLAHVFFWSLLASGLLVWLIPSRYEAVTKIMPPDNQASSGMAMLAAMAGRGTGTTGNIGALAGDLMGVKTTGAVFEGILASRTVQDRLIQQFDLRNIYHDSKLEDLRKDLAKHTDISEERKSGIISVAVWDHDPKRAAEMATAYVHELDRLVAEVSTSSARRERIFLEGRLQSVKQDLDSAALKFSQFASKNTAIDIPAQSKAMVDAAARLQGELIVAESELRGLEAIYTAQNSRVRALRARVSELHAQLGKLGGDSSGASASSSESASDYPSIRRLPVLGVTYSDLYRQTKIQETVYELLTQQYELAKVQEAKEIPSVKVLDVAVVPTKKIFPPRAVFTIVLTFICVGLAAARIFAKRRWNGISPEDPGKQFAQEIVRTLRADAGRLVPQGSFLRRMISRNGSGGHVTQENPESGASSQEQGSKVARVARNST